MSTGALVGFAVLLGSAFGVRTLIHLRNTGESGWQVPPTPAARVGDGLFTIGVVAAIAGPVLDLVGAIEPIDELNRLSIQIAGVVFLAIGGGLCLLAQVQMGASWRAGIDVSGGYDLVCDGLFRVVRNPFYLGIILAAAGVAVMVPNVVAILGWIGVLLGCEIDVRLVEEPHLLATKGRRYREYAAATGRFFPRLGRASTSGLQRL